MRMYVDGRPRVLIPRLLRLMHDWNAILREVVLNVVFTVRQSRSSILLICQVLMRLTGTPIRHTLEGLDLQLIMRSNLRPELTRQCIWPTTLTYMGLWPLSLRASAWGNASLHLTALHGLQKALAEALGSRNLRVSSIGLIQSVPS